MYSNLLSSRIEQNILSYYDNQEVATFIPPALLAQLVELAVEAALDLFDSCLTKRTAEDIAKNRELSTLQKWAIKRRVKKDDSIPKNQRDCCCSAIYETLKESSVEELQGLQAEVQEVSVEWGLF